MSRKDSASSGNFAELKKSASSRNFESLIRDRELAAIRQQPKQDTPAPSPPPVVQPTKKE
jgi:hypothetical protein